MSGAAIPVGAQPGLFVLAAPGGGAFSPAGLALLLAASAGLVRWPARRDARNQAALTQGLAGGSALAATCADPLSGAWRSAGSPGWRRWPLPPRTARLDWDGQRKNGF
ncbi:hypothetical protein AAC691_12925 [Nguyenibacter vanlangensis]|uniref:Uncharacterized protein n=1 Tax=Nguyenibacter vanlangensis TaxID=1216886 RepID=A0ABZ3D0D8_9PROT